MTPTDIDGARLMLRQYMDGDVTVAPILADRLEEWGYLDGPNPGIRRMDLRCLRAMLSAHAIPYERAQTHTYPWGRIAAFLRVLAGERD